ncbi:hypothetical protein G8T71_06515 [Clostridium botulinum C/D]|uniref:hypothetical protein n=1 Tax=Clostridium botulinum TaxID=1491 RepID=UPI001E3EE690|nr:hypothetical protein [Clostridium botulinum]MCD3211008.1 hypothetical protein [Clostridium botulinum C/D]
MYKMDQLIDALNKKYKVNDNKKLDEFKMYIISYFKQLDSLIGDVKKYSNGKVNIELDYCENVFCKVCVEDDCLIFEEDIDKNNIKIHGKCCGEKREYDNIHVICGKLNSGKEGPIAKTSYRDYIEDFLIHCHFENIIKNNL